MGPKFYLIDTPQGHEDTHGMSYIAMRDTFKDASMVMGFDSIDDKMKENV